MMLLVVESSKTSCEIFLAGLQALLYIVLELVSLLEAGWSVKWKCGGSTFIVKLDECIIHNVSRSTFTK